MYDDIANNEENPRRGIIVNSPHGEDVYNGVPKVRLKLAQSTILDVNCILLA